MYKVLIVDDELLIRKRISFGFEWEEMGFVVAGEAANGREALAFLRDNDCDVAIVDIAMPVMDGVEMLRQLRAQGSKTEIVFLTGHSDFEYARAGIDGNVYSYILKPLNEEEFTNMLSALKEKLDHTKELQMKEAQSEWIIENQKMINLVRGLGSEKERELGQVKWLGHTFVIVRIIDFYGDYLTCIKMCEEIARFLGDREISVYYDIGSGDFLLLVPQNKDDRILYEDELMKMKEKLYAYTQKMIAMGVGRVITEENPLRDAYCQAVWGCDNCLVSGQTINFYQQERPHFQEVYMLSAGVLKELRVNLRTNAKEAVKGTLRSILLEMQERKVEYREIIHVSEQLLSVLAEELSGTDIGMKQLLGDYYSAAVAVRSMCKYEELYAWFDQLVEIIGGIRTENHGRRIKNELVNGVKKLVEEDYDNYDLSVKMLADSLFVSDSYLSATFKRVMGISLVQYITQYRLEKAREFLLAGNGNVSTAAAKVGYKDEYYFSRCFKKYYGISPFYLI